MTVVPAGVAVVAGRLPLAPVILGFVLNADPEEPPVAAIETVPDAIVRVLVAAVGFVPETLPVGTPDGWDLGVHVPSRASKTFKSRLIGAAHWLAIVPSIRLYKTRKPLIRRG